MRNAVIVSAARTAVGKAPRGSLRTVRPDDLAAEVVRAVIERAGWWAEIFETPCVAYAPDAESIPALVETGAEFVALGAWAFEEGRDIRALVEQANAATAACAARKAAR